MDKHELIEHETWHSDLHFRLKQKHNRLQIMFLCFFCVWVILTWLSYEENMEKINTLIDLHTTVHV